MELKFGEVSDASAKEQKCDVCLKVSELELSHHVYQLVTYSIVRYVPHLLPQFDLLE